MKLKRIEAHAHIHNIGSNRTLEKAGFTREGLLRQRFELGARLEDCFIYSLLSTDK
jgi:RimJ/RimL family protein N-acetyltransferase